jgi:hypothetical protein
MHSLLNCLLLRFGLPLLVCGTAGIAGPALECVPGPLVSDGLPAPATWPTWEPDEALRILVITGKGDFLSPYQRIARRLGASLDVRHLNGPDAIYHVNDKWIEPETQAPTNAELTRYAEQVVLDTLAKPNTPLRYDIVFGVPRMAEAAGPLLGYMRSGGVVVAAGDYYPEATNALAAVWPARPSAPRTWTNTGATRTDSLELAGVPIERLTAHAWIPVAEPANGGRALAINGAGAMFVNRVGKGALLYVPTGLMSRHHNMDLVTRDYDHDEIWLRAWAQVLPELCGGHRARPAFADVTVSTNAVARLHVRVVNRSAHGPLAGSVHVSDPRGRVVYRADVPVVRENFELDIPVAPSWRAGLYPVYFTLGEPSSKTRLHQALTFLPVTGAVSLALSPTRRGFATGEEAQFELDAASAAPWEGQLRFGVYDFRGRLLGRDQRTVTLGSNTNCVSFAWRVADHGVRVDTYRAVVTAVKDGVEWARAEARFYRHDRWNMRNEYQWSTWAGLSCLNPSTMLPAMRLMAHAGMNSLGYSGRSGLHYPAERWGWRYYDEGLGMKTDGPLIEYENDAEIEAALRKMVAYQENKPELVSAAYVLASVGEEAGFGPKRGWGATYYWETPIASEKGCRAFQWYLKTKYADLRQLNSTWHTQYTSWEDVKLSREFSGPTPKLEADGWAHPKESPLGGNATAVSLAPYGDTAAFYAWYYDRIIAAAKRIFRERINPVTLTMSSAPSSWIFASRECDVPTAGPHIWTESQWHALEARDEPTFGLIWGHFDWLAKDEDMFWGFLLQRTGHNDYWRDLLMFNGDMTHTRSTMAMRRWTARLAGHDQALLDGRLPGADVGLLAPNGLTTRTELNYMQRSLRVAMMQAGVAAEETQPSELSRYKIAFAVGRQSVSRADADQVNSWVERGGTLVFTARFASQDEWTAAQPTSPGQGLAERWGLHITNKVEVMPRIGSNETTQATITAADLSLTNLVVSGWNLWREQSRADGWTVLGSYPDGTPCLLTRPQGRGRLYYLNAIYVSHRYIQWRTPTDAARQGFFKLVEAMCLQAGARQSLRLEGDLEQVLHTAVQQFTDASGHIRHVVLKNSIEAPWVAGRLEWKGNGQTVYDVLNGARYDRRIPFHFRPNEGRWLAITERAVERIRVNTSPQRIIAGEPVRISIRIQDAQGRDVPGKFPLTLRVHAGAEELQGLRRAFSLESGGEHVLQTALTDKPGTWKITITDGISGTIGTARLSTRAPSKLVSPGFTPGGWPSELAEPVRLSSDEFLRRVRELSALYQTDQGDKGWLTKQMLGAFYDFFPGTRHALLRPLCDVDWTAHVADWRAALQRGDTFVLTGEDLGIDPETGLTVYPHHDARQFAAVAALLRGAEWRLGTADGDTIVARLGKGRLVLCRESIDAAGHTNADAGRWQRRWLEAMRATTAGAKVAPMDETRLRRWWTGEVAATTTPRTIAWFADNQREVKLAVDPARPLDSVFVLVLPPTGVPKSVRMEMSGSPGEFTFDVGADDIVDGVSVNLDWPAAIQRYLEARDRQGGPVRDGSGWRLVPVRVRGQAKGEITLHNLEIKL